MQAATHTQSTAARLLLVDDDVRLAETIARGLREEGYAVDVAHTGNDAVTMTAAHDYDAVVLDVMLPGIDGHAVCERLRERDRWVPVLMLTALDAVSDRIRGLDSGADDYLIKPFDFGELLARLRALIRRGPSERPVPLEADGLVADPVTRIVTWGDQAAELTPREFALLAFMLRRRGEVISRSQLLEQVWSEEYAGSPNIVDVYIGYLRRKLERPDGPRLIQTVRGVGFRLDLPTAAAGARPELGAGAGDR